MAQNDLIPIEQLLPVKIPVISLMGKPIFPGIFTPMMLSNQEDISVVNDALENDGIVGLVLMRNELEKPSVEDLFSVGTVAKIVKRINLPDGSVNIFISTLKRFHVKKYLSRENPVVAAVDYLDDEMESGDEVKALTRAIISEMKQISENNPMFSEEMRLNMVNIDHPGKIADFIASIINIDRYEQQKILEMVNVRERMERVLVFIKKEQELLKIQKRIQAEINDKIEKSQRDYFLREELKAIKAELGMPTDAKGTDHQKFREKIDSFRFEGETKEMVEQELEKFGLMDPNSSEFIVTRNWLELVCSLPWKAPAGHPFDIQKAREILEADHYGLKDVKDRIIEYVAVRKLKEIDKMGSSYQGDPSSALLEALDPEQNFSFRDHYLDLPFDISNIFFICTANTLDTVPPPLLDRMEVIQLPGYIDTEKLEIAKHFLVPKSLEKNGLRKARVKYTRDALVSIAESYARESGVRNFEKLLDKVHRKIAKLIVVDGRTNEKFLVDKPSLAKYLGQPYFDADELKRATRPGMAVGLAWTSMGGDTLIIEAVANPGKEGLKLTGKMGEVMQESASIAYTYVRHMVADRYGIGAEFFEERQIHLHIPEGATPKDGPSAGITMATALLSLVLGRKIKDRMAMTGELSLTGQVLPIGGLKEKTVAAKRNKIRDIIIPRRNMKDLEEIPENVRKGIEFHPVDTMEDVIGIALPE
ncbi:MAG: LON peptidase substrate-binding domain-containing protein [Spirochaetes bacterium]|nr:LON peptidase substrate-binding domain-containing protein [Spirochaetota bacterium]